MRLLPSKIIEIMFKARSNKKAILLFLGGLVVGFAAMIVANYYWVNSSKDESCMSCHYHTDADDMWRKSVHYNNESGTIVGCAECHLPPQGSLHYAWAKASTGVKDVWSYWTKDKEEIDWESKGDLEYARTIVFNESCEACHTNLLPKGVSDEAIIAHLYYEENRDKLSLQCIDCHLDAGHYNPNYVHGQMTSAPVATQGEIYADSTIVTTFENYVETIPGTSASISMIAIPGGEFVMGSSAEEPFARANEMPQRRVTVSPFFMAEVEITWDQYWAFYGETMSEGRTSPAEVYANNSREDLDAVSGPTAPFGSPDQGWGMGSRPAITMTHYAAETFCKWLSLKTGKHYRLPTEAEWEYAARGGTSTPYFFEGDVADYSDKGFWRNFFAAETDVIKEYAIYAGNSRNRTADPSAVKANPFGLKNMLGNVMEYCSDWYAEDAYSQLADGAVDPKGPAEGSEHVVRGGNYSYDASAIRSAFRASTHHANWLRTDPQNPKSIWWYSNVKGVGFRVVCDVPEGVVVE